MILENIDIGIDVDKAILQNIDIDKILNRSKFGISNRAICGWSIDKPARLSFSCSLDLLLNERREL